MPPPRFPRPLRSSPLLLLLLAACATSRPHPRAVEEVRRGYDWLSAGDRERAEVAFEHALEMAPDLAEARLGLAIALRSAGRTAEALVQLDAALAADADLAEAHAARGEALAALGRGADADAALAESLRLDPDQVAPRVVRARRLARAAAAATGEERRLLLLRARRDLLHATEARPHLALPLVDLGWVSWLQGDLGGAAEAYGRAARLDPSLGEAWLGDCAARAARGDRNGAAASCRRCVAAGPAGSETALRCAGFLGGGAPPAPASGSGQQKGAPVLAGAPR